jgi:hypothetical protein
VTALRTRGLSVAVDADRRDLWLRTLLDSAPERAADQLGLRHTVSASDPRQLGVKVGLQVDAGLLHRRRVAPTLSFFIQQIRGIPSAMISTGTGVGRRVSNLARCIRRIGHGPWKRRA